MDKDERKAEKEHEQAKGQSRPLLDVSKWTLQKAVVEKFAPMQFKVSSPLLATIAPKGGLAELYGALKTIREATERRIEKYPLIAQKLSAAANHCWFLTPDVDLHAYEELAMSIPEVEIDVQHLDSLFVDFYLGWFNYLSNHALKLFPHRAFALKPAFSAHERGEYALSVPIFFAQADGIVAELAERELFTKHDHISGYAKEKIRESAAEGGLVEAMDLALLASVSEERPMGWAKQQRKKQGYDGLNRNTVMHGIDLNYATLANSLKAFSLLAHIVGIEDLLRTKPRPD